MRVGHIPSQPQEKHLFGLENYEKITSRICKIEGDYYYFFICGPYNTGIIGLISFVPFP